jgi:D-tyrosyl-tRNA(Tyr) deacylase|tara:strand:+ start:725 stop:1162 length:438 start_codon:yes stop_codon:yes gene_type:complete
MISVLQRCHNAKVTIDNQIIGKIGKGLVSFLGIQKNDDKKKADILIEKTLNLRIFNDSNQKMNLCIKDVNASILVVSQFTLCADTKKGRRPSFLNAANPEDANILYQYFINCLKNHGFHVESGTFGATMDVQLINNGPATFILNS